MRPSLASLPQVKRKALDARMRHLAVLALVIAASGPALAQGDPLAPARSGKVLCFQPDARTHTCRSIVSYGFGRGGEIDTVAETMLSETGPVIMNRTSVTTVRGDLVCGRIEARQLETATFTIAGRPASAADTSELRRELQSEYADLMGSELCTRYVPEGRVLRARIYLDEVPQNDITDIAVWINRIDGYRVSPAL